MVRVAFLTLGCKLNFAESSSLSRQFEAAGYERVLPNQNPDIVVVNSCTVTDHADGKCRQAIRHIHRANPQAMIVVLGCYAQLKPQEILDIEGVQLVFGAQFRGSVFQKTDEYYHYWQNDKLVEKQCLNTSWREVEEFYPAVSLGDRTRSFLKVQDGCNLRCSYCTIPLARGRSRNIPISNLVQQAREVAAAGTKEIVITGVNIGDFGRSTGESFADLVRALAEVDGIERYRISSLEPDLLKPEVIEFMGQCPKYMPHFHIPLQSGSDKVLRLMRRRYDTALFRERIELIRKYIPHSFIGLDVIVGFTGETQEDFETEVNLLEDLNPAFLHLFPYSMRPNTYAVDGMPVEMRVQEAVKRERMNRLQTLCNRNHLTFCKAQIGKSVKVLWESKADGGKMSGYTPNYVRVSAPWNNSLIGNITEVTVTSENLVIPKL